ncbi:unnamed protein product [Vicia faba]|uniref:Reverse transcriptase n=1 Tax=Vicia faba TaxID=3906 RepID=A0AAV1APH7_VICFA|nr:unnamed protein product [Vicia faba]
MHWLKNGDLNTKSFHQSATARKKFKKIEKLINEDGYGLVEQQDIGIDTQDYFERLFTATAATYDLEMHPDKSPVPDSFSPIFYQKFWDICGDDIFTVAKLWRDREE